jgi:hypothetical protein
MAGKQNIGKHTDESVIVYRILDAMSKHGGLMKSAMGRVAYPDYNFKKPQGAAFSIAKVASKMYSDKLIRPERAGRHSYEITDIGQSKLIELQVLQQR